MDNPLRLDDLTLDALNDMASMIVGLKEAGYLMREQGFEPRFDLRPGFPVRMMLEYRMPMAAPMESGLAAFKAGPRPSPRHPVPPAPGPDFLAACDAGLAKIELDDDGQAWIVVPEPEVKTEAEDLTLQGAKLNLEPAPLTAADIETAVSGAFIAVTGRDPKPVPQPAQYDNEDAAAPAPVKPAASGLGAPWTKDEDRKLVQMASERMALLGHSKAAASDFAAVHLGRPVPGTYHRLRHQLAQPLADAIAALQARQSEPAAPDEPGANTADSGGGADPSPAAPIASTPAPSIPAPDMAAAMQHLLNVPSKGGWTVERDRELLELLTKAWGTPEIAMEMQLSGRDVTDRYNLLTKPDPVTKVRAFSVAVLMAAMDTVFDSGAPAAAAE